MAYEDIVVMRGGGWLEIRINRSEKMNSIREKTADEILQAMGEVEFDRECNAVILSGGEKAFCTGIDTSEFQIKDNEYFDFYRYRRRARKVNQLFRELPNYTKPVISAVNGPAAGAGASLALSADLVVAKESAYFLLACVNIGLVPDAGSSLFVPARVGFTRAAEMAMLGEPVPAPRAADIGLINVAWPDEDFEKNAEALLLRLGNGPTRSYAGAKRELNHWVYSRMQQHLSLEASIQGELSKSKDFAEGVRAFLEKRPTHFTGE